MRSLSFLFKKAALKLSTYAECSGDGVAEDGEVRGIEGEEYEGEGKREEGEVGEARIGAVGWGAEELFREIEVGDGGADEENCDVNPIGGLADRAVVGVEENGNQGETEKNRPECDERKIRAVAKEARGDEGEEKHRPKEELHMLPG